MLNGDNNPSPYKLAADIEYGNGPHAGLSGTLDAHGNVEITPKFGIGTGELGAFSIVKGVEGSVLPEIGIQKSPNDTFWGSR